MDYWNDIITQKSFEILKKMKSEFPFILIGGWAVYLYTKSLKSKDIDIIVEYEILEKLKKDLDIIKNERLKKYEAKIQEIDIDIYVPFFSNPGLPPQTIKKYITSIENFTIPKPEVLLILKQHAYIERKNSIKGEKDKIDIISLLKYLDLDFSLYFNLLKENKKLNYKDALIDILQQTNRVNELNINNQMMAKLRKKIALIFNNHNYNE
jgi:hypothetical protein